MPLSKTNNVKLGGFCHASVGKPQAFISKAPSPSSPTTLRLGKAKANPIAIEETKPSVRHLKFPSPGRIEFHSAAAPPTVLMTRASPISSAAIFKQSNLFIVSSPERPWSRERPPVFLNRRPTLPRPLPGGLTSSFFF